MPRPVSLALALVLAAPAAAQPPAMPKVEQVIAAALAVAGQPRDAGRSWRRRLAWAALLPRLSARIGQTVSDGELLDLRADAPSRLGLSGYLSLRWEVRASWDLSRLLFDGRELRISSRSSQLERERSALVERVVQLYFERLRLILLAESPEPAVALERRIALQRVTALLDAMTGGLLSACEERQRR
jgi:hypothetical protein